MHNASGALVGGASSDNHLGGHGEGVDYEVPENIKTLHHLALQYVNQVRQCEVLCVTYMSAISRLEKGEVYVYS